MFIFAMDILKLRNTLQRYEKGRKNIILDFSCETIANYNIFMELKRLNCLANAVNPFSLYLCSIFFIDVCVWNNSRYLCNLRAFSQNMRGPNLFIYFSYRYSITYMCMLYIYIHCLRYNSKKFRNIAIVAIVTIRFKDLWNALNSIDTCLLIHCAVINDIEIMSLITWRRRSSTLFLKCIDIYII